jgi:O-antigen/teichoic acid export membrane protein
VNDLDRRVVRGSAWLALSYGGSQAVTLVVTAVLAHRLPPASFGLLALAGTVLFVVSIVQESGLGVALIQRRADVHEAAASVFVVSTVLAVALYGVAFAVAPLVASLLHTPRLTAVIRVLALVLVLRGPATAPGAVIERELLYGLRARGELAGIAAQAGLSIALAFAGAGVWSLVAGQLAGQLVQTVVFWIVCPIRLQPRRASWRTLRELARFGRAVTASNLVAVVDSNVDTITVGRLFNAGAVGSYNLAWRLSNLPATGIGYIVGRAMLPAYSSVADDAAAFREAFLANQRRVTLVSLPISLAILVAARPIVLGLFGAPWHAAILPLQILAFFGLVRSFSSATGAVFQAAGRPQLVFWISVWHLAVLVAALAVLAPIFGVPGVAAAVVVAAVSSLVPSYVLVLRLVRLPLGRLARELERPSLCALPLVGALVIGEYASTGLAPGAQLAMLVVVGALAYSGAVATIARAEVRAIAAAFRT